jgi:AcrR family transcriptional regulator
MNESDPRVKRTRKLLMDAFRDLLHERRLHDITVQDIADRATVNRATFYAHFVDKHALLDEMTGERFRAALASRVSPREPFTPEHLAQLIAAVLETQAQFHDGCQQQAPGREISPLLEAKVQQELNTYLLEWLRLSPPPGSRPGRVTEVMASAMSWAIFGAAVEWTRGARSVPADALARQMAALLIGGLAALDHTATPAAAVRR